MANAAKEFESLPRDGFFTANEVSAIFRVSKRSIQVWTKKGKLHPVKMGHYNLFDREEVAALLNERAPEGVTYYFTPTGKLAKRTAKKASGK